MNQIGQLKDVTSIEHDIKQTRQRLSHDLAMLDREYAARSMFVHALRFANQGKNAPPLVASAKYNAAPLALIAIGLTWLAFADPDRAVGRRLREAVEQTWRLLETVIGAPAASTRSSTEATSDRHKAGESL